MINKLEEKFKCHGHSHNNHSNLFKEVLFDFLELYYENIIAL